MKSTTGVFNIDHCGLYYKHIKIINYDSSIVNKFGASLADNARVVIYDHHMFIVQEPGVNLFFIIDTFISNSYVCLLEALSA